MSSLGRFDNVLLVVWLLVCCFNVMLFSKQYSSIVFVICLLFGYVIVFGVPIVVWHEFFNAVVISFFVFFIGISEQYLLKLSVITMQCLYPLFVVGSCCVISMVMFCFGLCGLSVAVIGCCLFVFSFVCDMHRVHVLMIFFVICVLFGLWKYLLNIVLVWSCVVWLCAWCMYLMMCGVSVSGITICMLFCLFLVF